MSVDGIDYRVGSGLVACVVAYHLGDLYGLSALGLRVAVVVGALVGVVAWRASPLPNKSSGWPWRREPRERPER